MAKYQFTRRALNNLTGIWDYTLKEWSENQVEKYYNFLIASCMELANNPKLGKTYDILSMNVIGYKCSEHIIFYREISKKMKSR